MQERKKEKEKVEIFWLAVHCPLRRRHHLCFSPSLVRLLPSGLTKTPPTYVILLLEVFQYQKREFSCLCPTSWLLLTCMPRCEVRVEEMYEPMYAVPAPFMNT